MDGEGRRGWIIAAPKRCVADCVRFDEDEWRLLTERLSPKMNFSACHDTWLKDCHRIHHDKSFAAIGQLEAAVRLQKRGRF